MKYHSQNNEAEIIKEWFGGDRGFLLDIGANDGKTFSNSYDLLQDGWVGVLLEPSPIAFEQLQETYNDVRGFLLYNYGIAAETGTKTLYESGAHVPGGSDKALVSTIKKNETDKWKGVQFTPVQAEFKRFAEFRQECPYKAFSFITIDAEGCDWEILQQINLSALGCRCLCIEWNSIELNRIRYMQHCLKHGLQEIHRNAENIIFAI